ncbi:MAG: alanine--tRNA ligase [Nocardioidaceae bacterium]
MQTAEIRRRFLAHFENADHTVVPSASLLFDDPNLLFVAAGMVPFVPYFTGQQTPPYKRAVSVQKCLRTTDIEEVGKTSRHGTFFQMNGNFSFGDYFKREAIGFAWPLLITSVDEGGLGLDPNRIWVTVFLDDDEAAGLWRDVAGLPEERIQRRGMADNFWSMGIPGPCGPSSEIFYDRGPQYGPDGGPVVDEDRFVEIWNLVFMQNERGPGSGKEDFAILGELPAKNIDTGMGLERVAYILQGKDNLYEIDEVYPVIATAAELSGKTYGADLGDDVRFRVVADHVRSALMLIGDGVTPGNESRGYVLRRLLRRAVRSMKLLDVEHAALPQLLPVSMAVMKRSYPQLERDFARISSIAYAEEELFTQTLRAGTQIFDLAAGQTKAAGSAQLSGAEAFQLHDTYGFPIDLTLEMAAEQGLQVDAEGFRALMAEQRARAKADALAKKGRHADTGAYRSILEASGPTVWLAYSTLDTPSRVVAALREGAPAAELGAGAVGELVLDRTPFYAESGGQNADAGELSWDGGRAEVLDVQRPIRGLVTHQVRVLEGSLHPGTDLLAQVDAEWRLGACQAHSGTHIVHAALRQVLGPTALQSGSYNRPGYLRLDFGWMRALSSGELHEVEAVANRALRADLPVSAAEMPLAQAQALGALALFGETYGDLVRVVEIGGPWSRELCGGTHVSHSSQVGTLVLTSDSSVGAGNRRLEALTGVEGFSYLARERDLVRQLAALVKVRGEELPDRVSDLVERLRAVEKELERTRVAALLSAAGELAGSATDLSGVAVVGHHAPAGAGAGDVRKLALDVRGRLGERASVVSVVGSDAGRASVVVAVNEPARTRGLSANELVKLAAGVLGGSGGGKDDIAQGGGPDSSAAEEALRRVAQAVAEQVGA